MVLGRMAHSEGRRRAVAAGLLHLLAWAVAAPLVAASEHDLLAAPVHLEQPNDPDCPAAHNHLFCQAVRSLASPMPALLVGPLEPPAPAGPFLEAGGQAVAPAGLASLVGSVVPRGPPAF